VIKQKLPPGAQRSEFLLDKGMIDCIVNRHELKEKLALFLDFLTGNERNGEENTEDSLSVLSRKLQQLMKIAEENGSPLASNVFPE